MTAVVLAACLFSATAAPTGDESLPALLGSLPAAPGRVYDVSPAELRRLMDYAVEKRHNIFYLLNQVIPILEDRKVRLRIGGEVLRAVSEIYDLGGDRVAAFLPTDKVDEVQVGARLRPGDASMDCRLTTPHSQYLEIGTIALDRHYGFRRVEGLFLREAFGARVSQFIFNFDLAYIEIEDIPTKHKIAIHARGFFRPKRWNIEAIERRPQ